MLNMSTFPFQQNQNLVCCMLLLSKSKRGGSNIYFTNPYLNLLAANKTPRKKKKTNQISSGLKSCMADGKGMRFQELINLSHDVLRSRS